MLRGKGFLLGFIAIIVAIFLFAVWWWGGRKDIPNQLSQKQVRSLVSEKNVALGYLESTLPKPALPTFTKLAAKFPEEPLGPQNALVAALMTIEADPSAATPELLQSLMMMLKQLEDLEPQRVATMTLASRVYQARQQAEPSMTAILQAAKIAPDQPAIWYEAYEQAQPHDPDQALEFLEKASDLAPNNLAIHLELIEQLAQQERPALEDHLEPAKQAFLPLEDSIQDMIGVSLQSFFSTAITAAREGNWTLVKRQVRLIKNATSAEDAVKNDRLKAKRNLLEFVIADFSETFHQKFSLSRFTPTPQIEVVFRKQEVTLTPQPENIRLVRLADVNADGTNEMLVLNRDHFIVFKSTEQQAAFVEQTRTDLPGSFSQFEIADLDADIATEPMQIAHSADLDVMLYGESGLLVLHHSVSEETSTYTTTSLVQRNITAACLGDFDHDGDLDIFLKASSGCSIWSNVDGLHFRPWPTEEIGRAHV